MLIDKPNISNLDADLVAGTATAGRNITLNATLGSELFTSFAAGNWTLTSGWEATNDGGTQLNKNADGTTTATLNTVAPTIGKTYKIVITVGAVSVASGATWTWGGQTGVSLTAAGTYTCYLRASSTGALIFTPTPTATRFTISAISIKEVTASTGTLTVENDILLGGALKKPDGTLIASVTGAGSINTAVNMGVGGSLAISGALSGATTGAFSGTITDTQTSVNVREIDGFVSTNTASSTAAQPVQASPGIRLSGTAWDSASRTTNRRNQVFNSSDTVLSSRLKWTYDFNAGGYNELMNIQDTGQFNVLGVTYGTECLTNGALTSGTSWSAAGDFALTSNAATYTHSSGTGTITQTAANLAVKLKPSRWYRIILTASGGSGTAPHIVIPNTIATKKTSLYGGSNSTYIMFFQTLSTVGASTDFVISGSSGATGATTIDTLSVKEVSGGVVYSDSIIAQGSNLMGPINYAADAQASDTYVITLPQVPSAYTTGMIIYFKANTANTGAATINVNGLGAKTIVKRVSTTLADNDILAGMFCHLIYDGTNFVLLNPVVN